jgi:hypothetical protein
MTETIFTAAPLQERGIKIRNIGVKNVSCSKFLFRYNLYNLDYTLHITNVHYQQHQHENNKHQQQILKLRIHYLINYSGSFQITDCKSHRIQTSQIVELITIDYH